MSGFQWGEAQFGEARWAPLDVPQPDQVVWRARRQPDGAVDTDLTDVRPVTDSINRFARSATAIFDDPDGTKKSSYPRGQRVELEYATDGGSDFTRRWAGFVQNVNDQAIDGRFKADLVGYDFFLRRERVNKTYSSTAISAIIKDLIQNFTAITHNSSKVSVQNDKSLTVTFEGSRVDEALDYLASASADERFGADNDFEFFFEQQDTTRAPADILNNEWLDYDLKEQGDKSLNRVKVYYGSGGSESFVLVEDRESQRSLKNKLGAGSNPVISEEFTYPNIANEDAAREKAQEILSENSTVFSGAVTTFDRFEFDPNEVFRVKIDEKGIDSDFAIAEIKFWWQRDETEVTVTEAKGNVEDRLVNLASDVRRVSMRDADTSAAGTRFLQFTSGVDVSRSAEVRQKSINSDCFEAGLGSTGSTASFEPVDNAGMNFDGYSSATVEESIATAAFLNACRDVWQGETAPDISHIGWGSSDEQPTITDNSLSTQVDRRSIGTFQAGSSAFKLQFDGVAPSNDPALLGTTLREFGFFNAVSGNDMFGRVTFDDLTHDGTTVTVAQLTYTIDDDGDEQGVVTNTGQERLRDLLLGETGHEPSTMVYGTGATDASQTDTSLGNQVHEDTLNSTADRSTGIADVVERIATSEANNNDLSELGEENSSNELLTRLVFEALPKTSDFALETNHRFRASNA